jgi:hypothetical protein
MDVQRDEQIFITSPEINNNENSIQRQKNRMIKIKTLESKLADDLHEPKSEFEIKSERNVRNFAKNVITAHLMQEDHMHNKKRKDRYKIQPTDVTIVVPKLDVVRNREKRVAILTSDARVEELLVGEGIKKLYVRDPIHEESSIVSSTSELKRKAIIIKEPIVSSRIPLNYTNDNNFDTTFDTGVGSKGPMHKDIAIGFKNGGSISTWVKLMGEKYGAAERKPIENRGMKDVEYLLSSGGQYVSSRMAGKHMIDLTKVIPNNEQKQIQNHRFSYYYQN